MPTYAYFTQDPATDTVTAATPAEAVQLAAQQVAQSKPENEGTSAFRVWLVPTAAVKAADCTYTVEKRTNVTVTPVP